MQQCLNCGHQNRSGVIYCENCGASLLGKPPLSTKSIGSTTEEEKANLGVDSSILTDVRVQGAAEFTANDTLRLEIEGSPEPIIFKPKAETIFGRRDPATGAMPDIDLTPFAGYRMGVSRRHAAIRQGDEASLNLWDLGSSNGTYLNGQKLSAHRPYLLHDGDELRLGQMMIQCHFQPITEDAPAQVAETKPTPTSPLKPKDGDAKPAAKTTQSKTKPGDAKSTAQVASPAPTSPPGTKVKSSDKPQPSSSAPQPVVPSTQPKLAKPEVPSSPEKPATGADPAKDEKPAAPPSPKNDSSGEAAPPSKPNEDQS